MIFVFVRGEPFDSPFALRFSKGEQFVQDRLCRTMNGLKAQSHSCIGKKFFTEKPMADIHF